MFEFYCPTRIIDGIGSVAQVGQEARNMGGTKALIVTDPGIVRAGLLDPLREALERQAVECLVFDGVGHDARVSAVDEAAAVCCRESVDVVIAIGGGSALAAGKGAAAIATNGGSLGDHQGEMKLNAPPLPSIAIPTSAGSGSEVSAAIPYYDDQRGRKTATRSPLVFPKVAILDGALLATLPFRQAVLSGVDALTHAMEAFLTIRATRITDVLALGAIELLMRNVCAAATTPDLQAKQAALLGSTMANLACGSAKLGLVHLLNRPVNTLYPEVPYGQSIGTLLVPVMVFNLPANIGRFARMAEAMGERKENRSEREMAELAVENLRQFLRDLRIETSYPEEIIDRESIPEMARMCAGGMHGGMRAEKLPETTVVKSFNRRQATIADVMGLYEEAFTGWS